MPQTVRILVTITLLLSVTFAIAQTSNVTATIVDTDGQAWANGTVQIVFIPTPGVPGPYRWSGGSIFPNKFSATMNSNGLFNVSIPDNNFISPRGSMWQFTLCSNTSAPCQNVVTPVTGPAPDISSTLNGQITAPRFGPGQFAFGYLDAELILPAPVGATYYNVSTQVNRQWNGLSWTSLNTGGTSFVSSQGLQAIPPTLLDLVFAIDPSGTCAYVANILNANQLQLCNSGGGVLTINPGTGPVNITETVNNGTAAMTTAAIGSGACGATVTVPSYGVVTTDTIVWSYAAPVGANPGTLILNAWPTVNNVNFAFCNPSAGSVTPTASTINWRLLR